MGVGVNVNANANVNTGVRVNECLVMASGQAAAATARRTAPIDFSSGSDVSGAIAQATPSLSLSLSRVLAPSLYQFDNNPTRSSHAARASALYLSPTIASSITV